MTRPVFYDEIEILQICVNTTDSLLYTIVRVLFKTMKTFSESHSTP